MSGPEFWADVFRATYQTPVPEPPDAVAIGTDYRRFFRGHHGPCTARWGGTGVIWHFPACPRADDQVACEAHIGFLVGRIEASLPEGGSAHCHRDCQGSDCCLAITWRSV